MKSQSKITLSELLSGDSGIITRVTGEGAFRKRITEMGFVRGKKVHVIKNAPLQDPIEYELMGYRVSLRRSEAALVEVVPESLEKSGDLLNFEGTLIDDRLKISALEKGPMIRIALVGNPNSGKTSLFNYIS